MNIKINYSFVIPHHNTPDLLMRLIDSIPQREDIEIIVVDDNSSPDKKANVSRLDVQTIYINETQSKGAGKARNIGMDASVGKWLLFADADDFYIPDFIKILDEYKDDDLDFVYYNIDSVDSQTLQPSTRAIKYRKLIGQYDGSRESSEILLFFSYTPWIRMFNASYVKGNGFRFEETIRANDIFFALQTSFFAKKWKVDKRTIYIYTYNANSLTTGRITKERYSVLMQTVMRISELYKYMGHPEWNIKSFKGRYSQSPYMLIFNILKKDLVTGLEACSYYFAHRRQLRENSYYYVDIIKGIENKK